MIEPEATHVLVPIEWINEQIIECYKRQQWTTNTNIVGVYQTKIDGFNELLGFEKYPKQIPH